MSFFDLDIRTILRLLVICNLVAMAMVFAYKNPENHKIPLLYFVLGKLFQALGWWLLSMRGDIPLWVSADLGNPLLFTGLFLEVAALGRLCQYRTYLERFLVAWIALGTLTFWTIATNPALMVVVSGTVVAGIYSAGGIALLWARKISHLQRLTAISFLAFCPILLTRVYDSLTGETTLLTLSRIQSITFMFQFCLLLVGAVGLLLLMKEADDRLLNESECRERERRVIQSRFIDMLTHELRAALSVIKVSGSSLNLQLADQPTMVTKRLSNISLAADAMNELVERCSQLERLDQGEQAFEISPCQLHDIIGELGKLHASQRERLIVDVPENASVLADHQLLNIMLENLVDNAFKYALPETPIRILFQAETRNGLTGARIIVENLVTPGTEPKSEQMFVRYFRGARAHEFSGTGLGLTLVRAFARMQGGDAEYRTEMAGQILISIWLPSSLNGMSR